MTTFYLGDCLEIMKDLSDNSIDCFICDLPYGQLNAKRGGKRVGPLKDPNNPNSNIVVENKPCQWDIKLDLDAFWIQVKRLARNEHTPVLMFCSTKFGFDLYNSNPDWFRYDLVWSKERGVAFLLANKKPMTSHEMIYVFSKAGAFYNRIDISGNFTAWKGHNQNASTRIVKTASGRNIAEANDGTHRCPLSVITIRKPNTKGHPTEKPEELYEWLLRRYVPENGTVLDPTAGSFNSCFVADRLGYTAIGIEKEESFFEKAAKKLTEG
jgi:site-specific DNA-methyltransferase (adenine-specific)